MTPIHFHWNQTLATVALTIVVIGKGLAQPEVAHLIATYVSVAAGLTSIGWTVFQMWRARKKSDKT